MNTEPLSIEIKTPPSSDGVEPCICRHNDNSDTSSDNDNFKMDFSSNQKNLYLKNISESLDIIKNNQNISIINKINNKRMTDEIKRLFAWVVSAIIGVCEVKIFFQNY